MAPIEIVDESHHWVNTCELRAAREALLARLTRIGQGRWYEMTTVAGHTGRAVIVSGS